MIGIFISLAIGIIIGFFTAALLGANGRDYDQEIYQAYSDGFAAGQGRPGARLLDLGTDKERAEYAAKAFFKKPGETLGEGE